jgi:hypothetical protein
MMLMAETTAACVHRLVGVFPAKLKGGGEGVTARGVGGRTGRTGQACSANL